ncbi:MULTISPECIES: hypothetical protein [Bacillota]|jgi:hypothetical protein|uniref:DUF4984 domain-containing protein n=2 Tax=Amedibacillus TaxID=2749846 RepID=A0A7G9GJL1_9FIRM|nr:MULTISPECIES: hypothetical protein [Bacillota]QNM10993.1 hypothetical protein H9Q80_12015 [[Eubacterium] hominis]MCH4286421.1 hypothetical protein [Amedibacillus hominis]RGB58485.1 hypothetical protein DW271_02025 [Absiella sp. AM22-9]RGB63373.1 hypothetical protein DW120_01065 [Absiella sp. AM10-20]RGB67203.1 hypothetical protein DW113_07560 [Absiella sp. AM09-45]
MKYHVKSGYKLFVLCFSFLLVACQAKTDIFQKENVRFFPSAFYYVGDPGKEMISTLSNGTEGIFDPEEKKISFIVQVLSDSEEDIKNFQNQITSVGIITSDHEISATANLYNIKKIDTAPGKAKTNNELDGKIQGDLVISFNALDDVISDRVQLTMKDGTVKNLDCDIQVHVEAFSKDLNVNYASNYKAIREKSSFDTNRGGFTFSNIGEDMKTFDMKDLVYDDTKMEATYDTQTDELILDGKEPWKTITYVCYYQTYTSQIYPLSGYIYFGEFQEVIDKLSK